MDAIVIAGDISDGLVTGSVPWLIEHVVPRNLPVIYVPGNHDFFGSNLAQELAAARLFVRRYNVTLLAAGESLVVGNTRFVGATLWTDFLLWDDTAISRLEAAGTMPEYVQVTTGPDDALLSPRDTIRLHRQHIAALTDVLTTPFAGATIVVTHHAPHPRSLRNRRPTVSLDAAYASDLERLIGSHQRKPPVKAALR